MDIREFIESIAYTSIEVTIESDNFVSFQEFEIDHCEEDNDHIILHNDSNGELKLEKSGLIIYIVDDIYKLIYADSSTSIFIKILE